MELITFEDALRAEAKQLLGIHFSLYSTYKGLTHLTILEIGEE